MSEVKLLVQKVTKRFGGLTALSNVDAHIEEGELVGLIGPNGAGKTTLFNVICGFLKPDHGRIFLNGIDITEKKPHVICRMGLSRTFQLVRPFMRMSVLDNVMTGAYLHTSSREEAVRRALEALEKVGLYGKRDLLAANLTLIDKKRMELARALACEPTIMLLDELLAGLNPVEIDEAKELIKDIHSHGITICIIEHVMRAVMAICERIIVLDHGEKIAEGTPQEVVNNTKVVEAYLGRWASRA